MTDNILKLLGSGGAREPGRIFGLVVGLVTNVEDPERLGRMRVNFPWLASGDESAWARVATPMAGPDRGVCCFPEVGDEVAVAFLQGDVRFPVVLGSLWNGQDRPPARPAAHPGDVRLVRTRGGLVIELDDTAGASHIELRDGLGRNRLTIEPGEGRITLRAEGDLTIESADGRILLKGREVAIEAQEQGLRIASDGDVTVKASGQVEVRGTMIDLN